MNIQDHPVVVAYRDATYEQDEDLGVFLTYYRGAWSITQPFGITQYKGIFRLILRLPLVWRDWMHWLSAYYHVYDEASDRWTTNFIEFFLVVYEQYTHEGGPPHGPHYENPAFSRIPLSWNQTPLNPVPEPLEPILVVPPAAHGPEIGIVVPGAVIPEQWILPNLEQFIFLPKDDVPPLPEFAPQTPPREEGPQRRIF